MDAADVNGAVIAAGLAALGYVGKLLVDSWRSWRVEQHRRRTRLLELDALLNASDETFRSQVGLARELTERLVAAHPGVSTGGGYDTLFTALYPQFDQEATDLHTVIRGYTLYGLQPLNREMLAWLRDDTSERAPRHPSAAEADLARELRHLDRHLVLWLAKCQAWLTDQPGHALVFLADEHRHGAGFPHGLEPALAAVLAERGITPEPEPSATAPD